MLKAELHAHTSDDPVDRIPYDAETLIDRAAAQGYRVLAITLHEAQFDPGPLESYAGDRGIVLLPGVERSICGKHLLLINFPRAAEQAATFDDVRRLKAHSNGLVIAPHPFYPSRSCLHGCLDRHAELFDAVEVNAFYTRGIDFNGPARRWARAHGTPIVGNGDVHRLPQLGSTYSLIDAPAEPDAICEAIRAGRVEVRTRPLSPVGVVSLLGALWLSDVPRRLGLRAFGAQDEESLES